MICVWPCCAAWCNGVYPFCREDGRNDSYFLGYKINNVGGKKGERFHTFVLALTFAECWSRKLTILMFP
jgi:hypothetical protein